LKAVENKAAIRATAVIVVRESSRDFSPISNYSIRPRSHRALVLIPKLGARRKSPNTNLSTPLREVLDELSLLLSLLSPFARIASDEFARAGKPCGN
jgi:hypothetical protein